MATNDAATLKVGNARFYTAPINTERPVTAELLKTPPVTWIEMGNTSDRKSTRLNSSHWE